jgi:uncharacterized membrane protein YsdA (DUF1294 family)
MTLSALVTPANIVSAAIILNVWTFMLFGIDKIKAENGAWRISEAGLLFAALIGGTIGAYAGRAAFRHKTRKQPFSGNLHGIAGLQMIAAVIATGYVWAG